MTSTFFYGPCWCGGDSTTGGHQHGISGNGNDTIVDTQQEAVLAELRAIRKLLEDWIGETP